ncbi:hypothetical protein TWF730_003215 [Orbilia blumenaviensis]|uniref:Peptidase A1 domain-containing protein n=1 Tax=Orbilia blumenaviensis TaxID=1796055 RepID=A0AAV9U569_9PEZI
MEFIILSILSLILLFSGSATAQAEGTASRAHRVINIDLVRNGEKVQTPVIPNNDSPTTWADLDYWSSLTWVPSSRYIPGQNSPSKPVSEDVNKAIIPLPNGTTVEATILNDNFLLSNQNISSLPFASVNITNTSTGVLGLGSDASVTINGQDIDTGLLKTLVSRKVINQEIYSIRWDPDVRSSRNGSLYLGGIDTNAYRGRLTPLLLTRTGSIYTGDISGINFTYASTIVTNTSSSDFLIPVIFDSTSPAIKLPQQIFNELIQYLHPSIKSNEEEGREEQPEYIIPCTDPPQTHLTLTFNKNKNKTLNIEIPFSQLISPYRNSTTRCSISQLQPSPDDNVYLGTIFHRSAYTVFDPSRHQMFIAPSSRRDTTDAPPILVEALQMGTGIDGSVVPDLEGGSPAPLPVDFDRNDASTPFKSPASSSSKPAKLKTEAIIGIVIAAVAILAITTLIILLYKKKKEDEEEKMRLTLGHPDYSNPTFRESTYQEGWMNTTTSSVMSFEDYVAVEGQGAGWIVETKDGIKHANWVKEGRFKLGK